MLLPQFHYYALDNEGFSMYEHAAQGMEHLVGRAKFHARNCSNNSRAIVKKTGEYFDLITTGTIYREMANLKPLLRRLNREKNLIFDGATTPDIEEILIDSMPKPGKHFCEEFTSYVMGSSMSDCAVSIASAGKDAQFKSNHNKMMARLKDVDIFNADPETLKQKSDEYLKAKSNYDKKEARMESKSNTKHAMDKMRAAMNNL